MTISLIGYLTRKVLKELKNVSQFHSNIAVRPVFVHAATKHGLEKVPPC